MQASQPFKFTSQTDRAGLSLRPHSLRFLRPNNRMRTGVPGGRGGISWVDRGPPRGGNIGAGTGVSEKESREYLWE